MVGWARRRGGQECGWGRSPKSRVPPLGDPLRTEHPRAWSPILRHGPPTPIPGEHCKHWPRAPGLPLGVWKTHCSLSTLRVQQLTQALTGWPGRGQDPRSLIPVPYHCPPKTMTGVYARASTSSRAQKRQLISVPQNLNEGQRVEEREQPRTPPVPRRVLGSRGLQDTAQDTAGHPGEPRCRRGAALSRISLRKEEREKGPNL